MKLAKVYVEVRQQEVDQANELQGFEFKSYDALHLACAESVKADIFLTTDDDIVKKATSLLYELQDYDLANTDFIHIGMHNHVYSYESWGEFNYKDKPQQYNNYNAFLYLFKILGLQKMVWIYPDYYTNEELMKHFENSYFDLHQKNFKLKFEALEANVYSTRLKDFDFSEYDNILYFTIIKNEPHLLNDEELVKLKTRIG